MCQFVKHLQGRDRMADFTPPSAAELDMGQLRFRGTTLHAAASAARNHYLVTFLTLDGERIAAIVPVILGEYIESMRGHSKAWLMKRTLSELQQMAVDGGADPELVYGVERPPDTSDNSDSP